MEHDERPGEGEGWPALAGSLLVAALGFFSIAAQALLFRGFIASFEGSEFGIGSFFGSWLGAVALGALAGRATFRRGAPRRATVALLSLLYLPAYLLQFFLIADIRRLAGVAPHEAFPLGAMSGASFLVNAPVGLVTGFLFTQACRIAPVARVYILEALGGFAGGAAVTLLLRAGAAAETAFLIAALPLVGSAALVFKGLPAVAVPVVLAGLLAGGAGRRWAEANDRADWSRLLPAESFRGSFSTGQGRYFYGEREGEFLVAGGGGVTESLPDRERASEVLALHLAQKPDARRVMVAGEGSLATCLRFAELPSIERVAWLHPDPDYPRALRDALPERFRAAISRIEVPGRDAREYARESPATFDLILLDIPDVTTLVLNRYATREFFGILKGALATGGVVSVRISGGANYLGGEREILGASMLANLEAVFARTALKPGEESRLFASDAEGLSTSPALLRDRFAEIQGAAALYPPAGLMALYPPGRIASQMERYRRRIAEVDESVLANTDRRPKALLFGLAASLRRAGVPAARALPVLVGSLFPIAAIGVVLYGLLRLLYLLRLRAPRVPAGAPSAFDAAVLAFSTGAAGMILSVVLLFLYQSRHGSLSLDVGLMSALFMLGLSIGGVLVGRLRTPGRGLTFGVAASAAAFLLADRLPDGASRAHFAALFVLAGGAMGAFFPVAARRMRDAGRDAATSGAALEAADHWGGAAGAVGGALLLLPVCGTGPALVIAALLVGINLVPALAPRLEAPPGTEAGFDRAARPAAYWILGFTAFLLAASQVAAWGGAGREGRRLEGAARELASPADVQERSATLRAGSPFPYFAVYGGGYVFRTRPLAGGVSGYGGPIDLAVHVDEGGALMGLRVLESRETPAYLKATEEWRKRLSGRNLFGPADFADAVTGATVTSDAIRMTLNVAGRAFASEVLGRPAPAAMDDRSSFPDLRFFVIAGLAVAAIGAGYPDRRLRRVFLVVLLFAVGAWLNLQYSTQQVISILGWAPLAPGFTASFFLAAAVPVMVALFGNVYCGWMCPFGALQELAGDLRGKRGGEPGPGAWRWGRSVKYVLLAIIAVAFALTRDPTVLAADPLTTFFAALRRGIADGWAFGLGAAAVALSFFFRRFWCRNLCPAGAFLSLLAGIGLLRRFLPAERPGWCDQGVRARSDLDCLSCDRCRHEAH